MTFIFFWALSYKCTSTKCRMINANMFKSRFLALAFTILFSLFSSVKIYAQAPANDDFANAISFTFDANGEFETNPAQYTTIGATADGARPAKWGQGPNQSVWFKFIATTNEVNILLDIDGASGTMGRPLLALYENITSDLASAIYRGSSSDIGLSNDALNIGQTYYISVDNAAGQSSYQGSFTLKVADQVTHDYKSAAIPLTFDANEEYHSLPAEFTTQIGTPDEIKGDTWPDGPNQNVWFKFTPHRQTRCPLG